MVNKFINKRVRHKCEDPNCPIMGKILGVKKRLDISRGKVHILWALVEWEGYGNIPEGYKQYVPLKNVEIIQEKG